MRQFTLTSLATVPPVDLRISIAHGGSLTFTLSTKGAQLNFQSTLPRASH